MSTRRARESGTPSQLQDAAAGHIRVVVASGDEDRAAGLWALAGLPTGYPGDVAVLALGPGLLDDPGMAEAARTLAPRQVVVSFGSLDEEEVAALPDWVRAQHWVDAGRYDADELAPAVQRAVAVDPATAARLGLVQAAARQWHERGRLKRDLIGYRQIAQWEDLPRRASIGTASLLDADTLEFLIASQLESVHGRRNARRRLIGLVALVVALVAGAVVTLVGMVAASRAAAEAEAVRQATDHAALARSALDEANLPVALEEATVALAAANTLESREAARLVASMPWPERVVRFGDATSTALSWAPNGRYLAVGDSTGRVALVALDSGEVVIRRQAASGEIRALGFVARNSRTVLAFRSPDGASVLDVVLPDVGVAPTRQAAGATSADGAFRVSAGGKGIVVEDLRCPTSSHRCRWWAALPGSVATIALWWNHWVAVGNHEGFAVYDVDALAARLVAAQDAPASGVPADRVAWLGYATPQEKTVVVTRAGEILWGDPSHGWGDEETPCVSTFPDCHGNKAAKASFEDFAAVLPPSALVHDPDPTGEREPATPTASVSPRGTLAVVVDVNGLAHVLRSSGGSWSELAALDMHLTGLDRVKAVFSKDEGAVALVDESAVKVTTFEAATGRVRAWDLPYSSSRGAAVDVNEDGGRVLFTPYGSASTRSQWFDMESGMTEVLAQTGSRIAMTPDGVRSLVTSAAEPGEAWPPEVKSRSGTSWVSLYRVVDTATGELLCQSVDLVASNMVHLVAPDLSLIVTPSFPQSEGLRMCRPIEDIDAALGDLRAIWVEV